MTRRLVILESPFAGDINANLLYAKKCIHDCLLRGEAPIASHLLFTQPGVLDDDKPEERKLGIAAGHAWYRVAEACVVYEDRGVSDGMLQGIKIAELHKVSVEHRKLTASPVTDKRALTGNFSTLEFGVGRRYRTRAGAIVEIVKVSDHPGYNWLKVKVVKPVMSDVYISLEDAPITTLGPDGRYSSYGESLSDIVEEVETLQKTT